MRQVIIIEKKAFSDLLCSHKKALDIIAVLEFVCRENDICMYISSEQIIEMIDLNIKELRKATCKGRIRFQKRGNKRYYQMSDVLELKERIDRQKIFQITTELCVPEEHLIIKSCNQ